MFDFGPFVQFSQVFFPVLLLIPEIVLSPTGAGYFLNSSRLITYYNAVWLYYIFLVFALIVEISSPPLFQLGKILVLLITVLGAGLGGFIILLIRKWSMDKLYFYEELMMSKEFFTSEAEE